MSFCVGTYKFFSKHNPPAQSIKNIAPNGHIQEFYKISAREYSINVLRYVKYFERF